MASTALGIDVLGMKLGQIRTARPWSELAPLPEESLRYHARARGSALAAGSKLCGWKEKARVLDSVRSLLAHSSERSFPVACLVLVPPYTGCAENLVLMGSPVPAVSSRYPGRGAL